MNSSLEAADRAALPLQSYIKIAVERYIEIERAAFAHVLHDAGERGDGTTSETPTNSAPPVAVQGLAGVAQLIVGSNYSCALLKDTTVRCWGYNRFGKLGDGTTIDRSAPVAVQGLADVAQIVVGDHHSCALLKDTTVRCWGYNRSGQLGDGTTINRSTPVVVAP